MKKLGTIVFGLLMIAAGIMHLITPAMYDPFISDLLPKLAVNYAVGVLEVFIGIGLFRPTLRTKASMALLALMIAFLPLHIADVFRENPAIGSHIAAYVRLPVQLLLVFLSYLLWKSHRKD